MSNTITLSTDMSTLYLIDDERAIPFDLTGKGAVIGTLGGQVSVVSASTSKTPFSSDKGNVTRKEFPTKNNQWTVNFNEPNLAFHVIGVVDIDGFKPGPRQADCAKVGYDLNSQIVSMRKIGDTLEILSMPILTSDGNERIS
ncbi:MAG: hypothetical protein AAGI23_00880 [Bacteroidota bacterium]